MSLDSSNSLLGSDSDAEISNESDASFQPDELDHSPEGIYSNNDDSDAEAVVDTELQLAIEVKRATAKVEPRKMREVNGPIQIRARQAAKRCFKRYLELKQREGDSGGEDQTHSGRSKRGKKRFHDRRYEEEQIPDDAIESLAAA